jgi:predicted HTH domain antitoxin
MEEKWGDIAYRTLELIAVESYRSGVLSHAEIQQMLQLSSLWEVEKFLKQANVYLDYGETEAKL